MTIPIHATTTGITPKPPGFRLATKCSRVLRPDRNKLTGLTEKGQIVPGLYAYSDPRDNDWNYAKTTRFSTRHEMLTGTQTDGTAFTDGVDPTCDNWTSNKSPAPVTSNGNLNAADGRPNAQIGFPDRNGGGSGSWNSAHGTRGCAQTDLPKTHGQGLFYCFAIN